MNYDKNNMKASNLRTAEIDGKSGGIYILLTALWPAAAFIVMIYGFFTYLNYREPFLAQVLIVNFLFLAAALYYLYLLLSNRNKTQLRRDSLKYCLLRPHSVISWSLFQSAVLILIIFAKHFPSDNHKAYWLGLAGISIIYSVSQTGFCWLNRRITH